MVNILGFEIFDCTMEEYMLKLIKAYGNGEKTVVVSGNPEVLYTGLKDEEIMSLCTRSQIIPDGIGVILAGRVTGQPFKEKIAGIEVMEDILRKSNEKGMKVYLLGAEDWVVERAASLSAEKYNAAICGYHDGYFDMDNCSDILDSINSSGADVLMVAMGCPRQERFIERYMDALGCKIFMGVGGGFDVLAGKVNRAPTWMIKLGLEWLYRVIKEPFRIKRLSVIPKFLVMVARGSRKA